jgi:hypothetical protein
LRKEVDRLVAARKRTSERAAAAAGGGTATAEVPSAAVIDGAEKSDRRYRMLNKYAEAIQGMVVEDAGREARPGGGGTETKVQLWLKAALWLGGYIVISRQELLYMYIYVYRWHEIKSRYQRRDQNR